MRKRTEDLLMERPNLIERAPTRDGIHKQEPLSRPHILLPHRSVTLVSAWSPTVSSEATTEREEGGWTHEYSSCPAVSSTSRRATSSSITHCFRYESSYRTRTIAKPRVSSLVPLLNPALPLPPPSLLASLGPSESRGEQGERVTRGQNVQWSDRTRRQSAPG
jgi:hypothetical protein